MKKTLLSLALLLMFVSCAKEPKELNQPDPNKPEEGVPTTASFTIRTADSGAGTKTLPTDAGESDALEGNMMLLVFNTNGAKVLNAKVTILAGASKKISVQTTSGTKRIFIIANVGDKALAFLNPKLIRGTTTLPEFYAFMTNAHGAVDDKDLMPSNKNHNITDGKVIGLGQFFEEAVRPTSMMMSNGASSASEFILQVNVAEAASIEGTPVAGATSHATNSFAITLKRTAAKAGLYINSTVNENLIETKGDGPKFFLKAGVGEIKYGLRNINRSSFLVQQFPSDTDTDNDLSDGGNLEATRQITPYYSIFTDSIPGLSLTNESFNRYYYDHSLDIPAIVKDGSVYPTDHASTYITENNNEQQVVGNSTYYAIQTTIGKIGSNDIVKEFNYVNPTVGDPFSDALTKRSYTLVKSDADYLGPGSTGSTVIIQRLETTSGINLTGSGGRAYIDEDLAMKAIFIMIEASGLLGSKANNDVDLNIGIWNSARDGVDQYSFRTTKILEAVIAVSFGGASSSAENQAIAVAAGIITTDNAESIKGKYTVANSGVIPFIFAQPNADYVPTGGAAGDVKDNTHAAFVTAPSQGVDNPENLAVGYLYIKDAIALKALFDDLDYKNPRIIIMNAIYERLTGGRNISDFIGIYRKSVCYYRLSLYEEGTSGKRHNVRRNHSYKAQVTGFTGIGEPTLEDLDKVPATAIDERNTHVTATIAIQPWHEKTIVGDV